MRPARFLPSTLAQSDRPLYGLLALALFVGFFLQLGSVPLFDVDEGAFGQATREMFLRGDFLSTSLNGQPRYDKPILSYWLQAASIAAFGVDEFAFRLPSAKRSSTLKPFDGFHLEILARSQRRESQR